MCLLRLPDFLTIRADLTTAGSRDIPTVDLDGRAGSEQCLLSGDRTKFTEGPTGPVELHNVPDLDFCSVLKSRIQHM